MKSKIVWLSKDEDYGVYEFSRTKKDAIACANGDYGGLIESYCGEFEELTGIKLKDGEVRKVRLEVIG